MNFVTQKIIDGVTYTLYREDKTCQKGDLPPKEYLVVESKQEVKMGKKFQIKSVKSDPVELNVRAKTIWHDNERIKSWQSDL